MFWKKERVRYDISDLEGVVTFFGAHHALKGESLLKKYKIPAILVPGPREISPNCGTALRFDYKRKDEIIEYLKDSSVLYEAVHHYPVSSEER